MSVVAKFEKVPFEEFYKALVANNCLGLFDLEDEDKTVAHAMYDDITLPTRATVGSAGYDFVMPFNTCFTPGHPVTVPTGIRIYLENSFLMLAPRSSLGFRYGLALRNTLGIVDSDYYYAKNYGHILAQVTVQEPLHLNAGDRFIQGIILPYETIQGDKPRKHRRLGGFGSTGK